jgi:hypothetical protein
MSLVPGDLAPARSASARSSRTNRGMAAATSALSSVPVPNLAPLDAVHPNPSRANSGRARKIDRVPYADRVTST